jgi:hypothetical protein
MYEYKYFGILAFVILLAGLLFTIYRLITMIGLVIFANITKKDRYEVSYVHQSIYYAAFFIPILAISYL